MKPSYMLEHLWDWIKGIVRDGPVRPYFRVRDRNESGGVPEGSTEEPKPKAGYEAGISVEF